MTGLKFAHVAARMFNCPLMLEAGKLEIIYRVLAPRLGLDASPVDDPEPAPVPAPVSEPDDADPNDRVAVINVTGSLVNRIAMEPLSSFASYERLKRAMLTAAADRNVKGILLRIESYGGECSGVADLADTIREVRALLPVWASVDDNAFSAAYHLAAQTDRVYVTRTGGVGSVGVIALHWDHSEALKTEGVKPTAIFSGKHKADFAPWQPLAEGAAEWLRALVDREYQRFVEYVSAGRGMDPAAVRRTEAALYIGQDGIDVGFADAMGTFDVALGEFTDELKSRVVGRKKGTGASMKTPEQLAAETAAAETHAEAVNAAKAAGITEGRTLERARWAAILGCEEAKNRRTLALSIATETEMEAEVVKKLLAAAPLEMKTDSDPLKAAMAGVPNPKVGTGAGGSELDDAAEVQACLAAYGKAKGGK